MQLFAHLMKIPYPDRRSPVLTTDGRAVSTRRSLRCPYWIVNLSGLMLMKNVESTSYGDAENACLSNWITCIRDHLRVAERNPKKFCDLPALTIPIVPFDRALKERKP
jgi:hypothetical protein